MFITNANVILYIGPNRNTSIYCRFQNKILAICVFPHIDRSIEHWETTETIAENTLYILYF